MCFSVVMLMFSVVCVYGGLFVLVSLVVVVFSCLCVCVCLLK